MQNKYNILKVLYQIAGGNDVIHEYDIALFLLERTILLETIEK